MKVTITPVGTSYYASLGNSFAVKMEEAEEDEWYAELCHRTSPKASINTYGIFFRKDGQSCVMKMVKSYSANTRVGEKPKPIITWENVKGVTFIQN